MTAALELLCLGHEVLADRRNRDCKRVDVYQKLAKVSDNSDRAYIPALTVMGTAGIMSNSGALNPAVPPPNRDSASEDKNDCPKSPKTNVGRFPIPCGLMKMFEVFCRGS